MVFDSTHIRKASIRPNRLSWSSFVAIAVALAWLPSNARADMIIDNWTTTQSFSLSSGTQVTNTVGGGGIVGGQRDVELRRTATESVSFNASGGQASITSSGGANHLGSTLFLRWDGALAGITPSVNLLADGSSLFIIRGLSNSVDIQLVLGVSSNTASTATNPIFLSANANPTDLVIPFSTIVNSSTIFPQVVAVTLSIAPQANSPFTVSMGSVLTGDISAVPEPTSLALSGLSVVALLGWRRRNIRQNVGM